MIWEKITTIFQEVLEAQTKTHEGGTKGNVESIKTKIKWNTNNNDMPNAQRSNASTQTSTHIATHVAMNFPKNTTARHASVKRRDTNMKQNQEKNGRFITKLFPLHLQVMEWEYW